MPRTRIKSYERELTNELLTQLRDAHKRIEQQERRLRTLEDALRRSAIAMFTDGQLSLLAEYLYQSLELKLAPDGKLLN